MARRTHAQQAQPRTQPRTIALAAALAVLAAVLLLRMSSSHPAPPAPVPAIQSDRVRASLFHTLLPSLVSPHLTVQNPEFWASLPHVLKPRIVGTDTHLQVQNVRLPVYFSSVCILTCPPSTSQRPLRPSAGMCTATRSRTARRWACAASQTSVSRTLSAPVHHKSPHPTPPPSSVAVFDPSAPKRLVIAAHYDTKIIADVVCLTSLLHLTSHHFTFHPHAEPRVHWRHRLCCAVCNAA